MRAFVSDDCVRVVGEDVLIIADGTAWDGRQVELVAGVSALARRAGRRAQIAFWSYSGVFERAPSVDEIARLRLAERGRYITPLVESALLDSNGRPRSLVCLVAGEVADFRDWQRDVASGFERVVSVGLTAAGSSIGPYRHIAAELLSVADVELVIEGVLFDTSVRGVAIQIGEGVPVELPDGFVGERDEGGLRLEWVGESTSLRIPLRLAVPKGSSAATVHVQATLSSGEIISADGRITCTQPPLVVWQPVPAAAAAAFEDAITAYTSGDAIHACAACGERHEFTRALRCDRVVTSFLDERSPLAIGIVPAVANGGCVVVARRVGRLEAVDAGTSRAVPLGGVVLLHGSGGWLLSRVESDVAAEPMNPTFPGLWAAPNDDIWLVEL